MKWKIVIITLIAFVVFTVGFSGFTTSYMFELNNFNGHLTLWSFQTICFVVSLVMFGFATFMSIKVNFLKLQWLLKLFLILNVFSLFIISFGHLTLKAREQTARNNTLVYSLKDVYVAVNNYTKENDGYLPYCENWTNVLIEYNKDLKMENFTHPKVNGRVIAYNKNIAGRKLSSLNEATILFFESNGELNACGTKEMCELNAAHSYVLLSNGEICELGVGDMIKDRDGKYPRYLWDP